MYYRLQISSTAIPTAFVYESQLQIVVQEAHDLVIAEI